MNFQRRQAKLMISQSSSVRSAEAISGTLDGKRRFNIG
jgi:hypothetical protein